MATSECYWCARRRDHFAGCPALEYQGKPDVLYRFFGAHQAVRAAAALSSGDEDTLPVLSLPPAKVEARHTYGGFIHGDLR